MKVERRYDIDWIRVLVFDVLIIWHVGMFFVPWWWVIKNNEIIHWMIYPMVFVRQWRLPILFVASGMGTRFALSYKTGGKFIKERFTRLFIPLIVGVPLVISPQVYVERLTQGKTSASFFEFFPQFFNGIYPEGNLSWHHLWFLPYLFLMSIIATPLFLNLRKEDNRIILLLNKLLEKSPFNLFLFTVPIFIVKFFLEPLFPVTMTLIGDWYALTYYFIFFITGFILISAGKFFWIALDKVKFYSLGLGIVFSCLIMMLTDVEASPFLPMRTDVEANFFFPMRTTVEYNFFLPILKTINVWSWILTIFGFGSRYLNRESDLIKYRNQAVYPFYILNQTIIVIIGYLLKNNSMHYGLKFIIMVIGTYGFSWLMYEFIIKRISIIRPLFGLKMKPAVKKRILIMKKENLYEP